MKAVIVDLQGKSAAALCEDGTFKEVPDKGYSPGQIIEIQSSLIDTAECTEETENTCITIAKMPAASGALSTTDDHAAKTPKNGSGKRCRSMRIRRIAASAAACFVVLGISAGTVWAMPYGKVYVGNGSSLSYTINRFDYVLDVDAEDESGKKLLDELDTKKIVNRKIDRAVEETLGQMESTDGEAASIITEAPAGDREIEILTDIKNERHARNIQNRLEKITSSAMHNTKEIPAGGPEEEDYSTDQVEENRNQEQPAGENPIYLRKSENMAEPPERKEERQDELPAQRTEEMSPDGNQDRQIDINIDRNTDIHDGEPEADSSTDIHDGELAADSSVDTPGSDSSIQGYGSRRDQTVSRIDDLENDISEEKGSFEQIPEQSPFRQDQEEMIKMGDRFDGGDVPSDGVDDHLDGGDDHLDGGDVPSDGGGDHLDEGDFGNGGASEFFGREEGTGGNPGRE